MSNLMCPRCGADLVERQRAEVSIDVCTGCRGVWLDRGELEKLMARASSDFDAEPVHRAPDSDRGHLRPYGEKRYDREPDSDRHPRGKKKFSIFDIFD